MNPAPPHPVVLKTPVSNGTVVVSNPQYTTTVQRRKEPRKTYITVLPGRPRPVFVRDRKKPFTLGFGCGFSAIAAAFAPPPIRRSYSAGPIRTEVRVTSATAQPIRVTSATAQPIRVTSAPAQPIRVTSAPAQPIRVTSAPAQPTVLTTEQPANIYPAQPLSAPPGTCHTCGGRPVNAETTRRSGNANEIVLQHTCSSCGKFRSPSYHSRHPLAPGESPRPGVCRKCVKQHTSSEESDEEESRHRRSRRREKSSRKKNHKRKRAKHSNSTKDSSSSKDEVPIIRRSYSAGEGQGSHRRPEPRSSPGRQARISISYEPGESEVGRSSGDGVRVVEATKYLDARRQSRSRSRSRDSSGDFVETARHLDGSGRSSGARIVENGDHFEDRRRSRSRSRSLDTCGGLVETVRYVNRSGRSRSTSSSRSPPRHLIRRIRYIENPMRRSSRSRARSPSRPEPLRHERLREHSVEEEYPIRYRNLVERQSPPLFRHVDYGCDEVPPESVVRRRPSILRRSESLDAHHRAHSPVHRRGYLDHSSGAYSRHVHEDRHYTERSYEYEPHIDPLSRPASPSVRVVRALSNDRGSEEHLAPRVRFARPASPRRVSVVERTEASEPVPRRRRRRVRAVDEDLFYESSEDYSPPEHYDPPRWYRATQATSASAAPLRTSNRNISRAPHEDDRDMTRMLERTHITSQPDLSPLRGRTPSHDREFYRSRSSSRRPPLYSQATAGWTQHVPARYADVSEDRVIYPELEHRERPLPPPAPLSWEGRRW